MPSVEFAAPAIAPELIEQMRQHDLRLFELSSGEIAPSDRPVSIGHLADLAGFSVAIDRLAEPDEYFSTELGVSPDRSAIEYTLPVHLAQFTETVSAAAAYEHSRYPWARYTHARISLHQSAVAAGTAQRETMRHFNDSIRRNMTHRDAGKESWLHIYVVSDSLPTEFFESLTPREGPFSLDISDEVDAKKVFATGEIVMANLTTFHRSPFTETVTPRTFFRLSYFYDTTCLR